MEQSDIKGGQKLLTLRQRANLTQTNLAEKAKVSRSMIAQLELGERRPSQKVLKSLCQAMEVSLEEEQELFLSYEFSPTGHSPDQIAALLRADKSLTSAQAEKIAALVREAYNREISSSESSNTGKSI